MGLIFVRFTGTKTHMLLEVTILRRIMQQKKKEYLKNERHYFIMNKNDKEIEKKNSFFGLYHKTR